MLPHFNSKVLGFSTAGSQSDFVSGPACTFYNISVHDHMPAITMGNSWKLNNTCCIGNRILMLLLLGNLPARIL